MTEAISNLSVSVDPTQSVSGLNRIISAYKRLTEVSDRSKNNINRQFNALNKGFKSVGLIATKTVNFISQSLSNLATQIAIVFSFSELVDAARKIEKFETTFLTFTGTLKLARKEINTLLAVTNRFGVSFEAAIIPFAKFAAATQDMAKSDIRNIFTSFIEASSALQLNMQEVNGVFLALQQIASKGRVSMEELRLQLAERIPGTMIIAANAMKMTMMEFEKAARIGAINVNEFLLKFAEGIHQKFGAAAELAANRLFAKMNRLNNAMLFFKERLFTTGKTGKAYSNILESITSKLTDTEMATGGISNILGSLLEIIEKIIVSISIDDINDWINSFTVFSKTVGITTTAVWNLSKALLNLGTLGSGDIILKTLRWPFDLAAAFDLARDGLLEFNDIMAASSYDELHTLVADVMTTDQGLQKLRVTYRKLNDQLKELQSQIDLSKGNIHTTALGREIRATQDLISHTGLLIKEKEQLMGLDAMKMDPQLKTLNKQYEELSETMENLELKYSEGGPRKTQYATEILQINDQIYALQILIDKRKEYFSIKPEKISGEEVPTKIEHPPSMQEVEQAGKFIERNNKLIQRGLDSLLSNYDRGIKKILDVYNEFHTKIEEFVKKQILTRNEADKYIKEMQNFTSTMYDHVVANKKVSAELLKYNTALQTAKDNLLPEYETGLNRINNEYNKLNDLAKIAAKEEKWDTTQIESVNTEISKLRESALSFFKLDVKNKALEDFNSLLQKIKNTVLPEYRRGLLELEDRFKNIDDSISKAVDVDLWSIDELKAINLEVNNLKDTIIALYKEESKSKAYIDFYSANKNNLNKFKDLSIDIFDALKQSYLKDMNDFIVATDNKQLAYEIFISQMKELNKQFEEASLADQVFTGMTASLDTYLDKAKDISSQVESTMINTLQNMEDALVNFCITGKLNFKEFANSIIKDILRIIVKQLILNAVMAGISMFDGIKATPSAGSVAPASASTPTTGMGPSPQLMAKGGVFDSLGLSSYSGQIVNSPTAFAFAHGMGLMGEAGPEAIMPLTRMPGGDLGVKTETTNTNKDKPQVPMQIHIHEAPGTQTRIEQSDDGQNLEVIIEQVEQAITGRMGRGTGMAPFMDGRYGRAY